jgi:hypothetical protein
MDGMRSPTSVGFLLFGLTCTLLACTSAAGYSSDSDSEDGVGIGRAGGATESSAPVTSFLSAPASDTLQVCPAPPTSGPTSSWADCSAGVDPQKHGGDLLWTKLSWVDCWNTGPIVWPPKLALGPTGDIGIGTSCWGTANNFTINTRLNGSGKAVQWLQMTAPGTGFHVATTPVLDRNNNFGSFLATNKYGRERNQGSVPRPVEIEVAVLSPRSA